MACRQEFVDFVAEQASAAGEIFCRKMFGGYGMYCNSVFVGVICDDKLFLKVTEEAAPLLKEKLLEPPYDGAKPCFYIPDLDDRDYGSALVAATFRALEKGGGKKRKANKK